MVQYFDVINEALQFTPEELALLEKNGFLVSDRLAFEQFKRAYAYIYWKDLPVLITPFLFAPSPPLSFFICSSLHWVCWSTFILSQSQHGG